MSSPLQTAQDSRLFPLISETNQRAFRSSATDGGEASVETDAIEDIFRLFIIEEVKHDAGAYPRSAEQLSANTGHSNVSCENKTEVMSQQPLDPESTTCRGQKQAATTKVLGDSQYRIRRPLSGSRRSQPSFLNPEVSSTHLTDP